MCDVVEKIVNKGIEQGIEQGREEVIRKMLDSNFATEQQIADLLKIPVSQVQKIAHRAPVRD